MKVTGNGGWLVPTLMVIAALVLPSGATAQPLGEMSDEEIVVLMEQINEQLQAEGKNYAVEQIDFFTIGLGRPSVRLHQEPFRWVAGDTRRLAAGNDITYIIDDLDPTRIPTSLGFFPTAEIQSAMETWGDLRCMRKVDIVERPPVVGVDMTIFDGDIIPFFCPIADQGALGDGFPFFADIVHAGWYPAACFGPTTLAFSISFIFVDANSNPTDINRDRYLDTALNEVYYNDAFSWETGGAPLPDFDVETTALHESGHSLGVGHFGPRPRAVMNIPYLGPLRVLQPIDHAGMCTLWRRWPR